MMGNNLLISILEELKVRYTKSFTEKIFDTYPNKESMYGLSKLLNLYHINNVGIKIDVNEKSLSLLDYPFVAFSDHELVLVVGSTADTVKYVWKGREHTISKELFLRYWSGNILLLEKDGNSIEPDYEKHKMEALIQRMFKLVFVCSSLFLLICLSRFDIGNITFSGVSYGLFALIGEIASFLLVQKQYLKNGQYADKVCSLFYHSKNCGGILELEASKILGISWSIIGLGYFGVNILLCLIYPSLFYCLFLINILALPYTFWSILYQKYVAKQYCTLCIVVQVCIWGLFFSSLSSIELSVSSISVINLLFIVSLYAVVILFLQAFFSLIEVYKRMPSVLYQLNTYKYDMDIFYKQLQSQSFHSLEDGIALSLGNDKAENIVTIISNPHCEPCAKTHKMLDSVYDNLKDKCRIQFVYTSFSEELNDSTLLLVYLYSKMNRDEYMKFLSMWYNKGRNDRFEFYKKYNLDDVDTDSVNLMKRQMQWIKTENITSTPTILFNGYPLPEGYDLNDLNNILDFIN